MSGALAGHCVNGRWSDIEPKDWGGGEWSVLQTWVRGWLGWVGSGQRPGMGSQPEWRGLGVEWVSPTSRLAQGPGPFPPQKEEGTGAEEHLSWRIAMGAGGDGKIWILYKKKTERERPAVYHAPRHHLAALPRPPRFQPEPSRSPKWDRSRPWRPWALGCRVLGQPPPPARNPGESVLRAGMVLPV